MPVEIGVGYRAGTITQAALRQGVVVAGLWGHGGRIIFAGMLPDFAAQGDEAEIVEEINRNIVNISPVEGQTAADSLRAASSNETFARFTMQLKPQVSHVRV